MADFNATLADAESDLDLGVLEHVFLDYQTTISDSVEQTEIAHLEHVFEDWLTNVWGGA